MQSAEPFFDEKTGNLMVSICKRGRLFLSRRRLEPAPSRV